MVGPAETPPETQRNFGKSDLLKVTLRDNQAINNH